VLDDVVFTMLDCI